MDSSRATTSSIPSTNPPSVEAAYKRKCIALKQRLTEVESENELLRLRNQRGWQYIKKMRLESCILLERLARLTGMAEEIQAGGVNSELRMRAASMLSSVTALNNNGEDGAENGLKRHLEDETDGSSDEQPPTPEERPLRVKRSKKSNLNGDDELNPADEIHASTAADVGSLRRLAPAPTQEELTSSFRIIQSVNGAAYPVSGPSDIANSEGYMNSGSRRGSGKLSSTTMHTGINHGETRFLKEEGR